MSTPSQIKENELITQLTWLKNILKEEVVEEIECLRKDAPKVAEDAEACIPQIACIFCLDTVRIIRDREFEFAWFDFRGEFDLLTCPVCTRKQSNWISCLRDKNFHENGRRVFHQCERNANTVVVELARIYNSEYRSNAAIIKNEIQIEGPKISINNN